ncbi:36437_t:CDS:2, partial [Gigaspora margarita]
MGKTHNKRIKIHDTRSKPIAIQDKENIAYKSSVSLLNMEQEQEQNVDTANNKSVDWSEDVDLELSVGEDPTDMGSSSFDEMENSLGNMAELSGKTAKNPDIMDFIMQEKDLNQNLGGKATYSSFAPRDKIYTKNDNTLIFNIQSLENISINNIVAALYAKIGDNFIAAKPHYKRGKRLYLE